MSSLEKLAAGAVLVATASLGVLSPVLEVKATPSLGDNVGDDAESQSCVPQFSVYFQLPERVIAIEKEDNSCPVASQIYVRLANDIRTLPPIVATQSLIYSQKWVSQQDPVAAAGTYGVLSVEYSPGRFVSRLNQIDHRIVIRGVQQTHPVAPKLTLEKEPPPPSPSPMQEFFTKQHPQPKQHPQVSLDAESKRLIHELLDILKWFKEAFLRIQAALTQTS
jgi:hypothetical protein